MPELKKIIDGGYCIGCGACQVIAPKSIKIIENEFLEYQAQIDNNSRDKKLSNANNVCPFSNTGLNEDELSKQLFIQNKGENDDVLGYYNGLFAGHVIENSIRDKTTSGGIITWTLLELLRLDLIDAVIHVKKTSKVGKLFEYGISKNVNEIVEGGKSRYYPVEISEVMDFVKKNEGRYAFVGLPCFNKAVRNLCIEDLIIGDRIKFIVGLVCGHLKSKAFAEHVGWQAGIKPDRLSYVDFRYKLSDRKADNYGIYAEDSNGHSKVLVARKTMGTNWGLGFFKYEACDYCDDIFSETADLSVGDAWLNQYTNDSKGNSVVVCRNEQIANLISDGIENGELSLDKLSVDEMRKSQGGGFRHRRSGLGYRLYLKQKRKEWAPKKRMLPNRNGLSLVRKLIYKYRVYLRRKSADFWQQAKQSKDYDSFEKKIALSTRIYSLLLRIPVLIRKFK